jgi:hypothetical protein
MNKAPIQEPMYLGSIMKASWVAWFNSVTTDLQGTVQSLVNASKLGGSSLADLYAYIAAAITGNTSLVYDSGVLAVAQTDIDVTGLNLSTHGEYEFSIIVAIPAGSYPAVCLLTPDVAGTGIDTTLANYLVWGDTQYPVSSGGKQSYSAPYIALWYDAVNEVHQAIIKGTIRFSSDGYITTFFQGVSKVVGAKHYTYIGTHMNLASLPANVTRLRFRVLYNASPPTTTLANGFGIGSRVKIWRKL